MATFKKQLTDLIKFYGMEYGSGTPDFVLAEYLVDCLAAFDKAANKRFDLVSSEMLEPETPRSEE